MKYLLYLSYIGTSFHGVQKQLPVLVKGKIECVKTVLGEIEVAWLKIYPFHKNQAVFTCSSRTDTDVHAIRSTIHVWFPEDKYAHKPIDGDNITKNLNNYFSRTNLGIRIIDTLHVSEFFCARRSAISRTYMYRFGVQVSDSQDTLRVPMSEWQRTYFFRAEKFDTEKIKEATQLFLGEKDHFAVMGRPSQKEENKSTIINISTLDLKRGKPLMPDYDPLSQNFSYYDVICTARSFLYRQVRRIVSVLIAVGIGKINLDDVKLLFDKPEPSSWNSKMVVPPGYGLYLLNVAYNEEDLVRKSNIVNVETVKKNNIVNVETVRKNNIVNVETKKVGKFENFRKFQKKISA